jgi:hypothetical protein
MRMLRGSNNTVFYAAMLTAAVACTPRSGPPTVTPEAAAEQPLEAAAEQPLEASVMPGLVAPEIAEAKHGEIGDITAQDSLEDQHFCCVSVDLNGKGSGENCTATSKELINNCQNVLHCNGSWGKVDDTVRCL